MTRFHIKFTIGPSQMDSLAGQHVFPTTIASIHGAGGGLQPLPLSVEPGSARLALADRETEAITDAGLRGIGAAGGMGRHGLDRALRIFPGVS